MPIWKLPGESIPSEKELYQISVKSKSDPVVGRFRLASNIERRKNPNYLGVFTTHCGDSYIVRTDDQSEVEGFKLAVPHL